MGRQEMEALRISISSVAVSGSGIDPVGVFTLQGRLSEDGSVDLLKNYLGQHRVRYLGRWDGSKRLWGQWQLQGMSGPWEIRLRDHEKVGEVEEMKLEALQ